MIELGPYTPVFLIIAFTVMALGLYVLIKGHGSPINRMFFYFALLAGVGNLLDLLMASWTTELEAAWTARLLIFLLVIELGTAYYLNSIVPFESGFILLQKHPRAYPAIVLLIAVLLSFSVGELTRDRYGWSFLHGPALIGVFLSVLVYVAAIIWAWWRKQAMTDDSLKRWQNGLFGFAIALPAAVMLLIFIIVSSGITIPRFLGIGELISAVVLTYGILRYDLLVPSRVVERTSVPIRHASQLVKGRAYLFEGRDPGRMFASVVREIQEGRSALIICRTHPDQLRAQYRLTVTPFIWLAQSPGPDRVDPSNLQMLTHMTLEYLQKGPSLIAVEGLEYLLTNNDGNKVLKFLGQLHDNVIMESSILVLAVDPRALTERQKALLERELEVIVEEEGAETAI